MKRANCAILLIIVFAALANSNEDNDNWPCYLKKCERKDPNLSTCLLHHSNRALSFIFAGDDKIGIPIYSPYTFKNLDLGLNGTLKLHFDEAKAFGIQNMHVQNISWNFDAKTLDIELVFNNVIYIGGNYISAGTLNNISMRGNGHIDLIFVGGSQGANITYSMNYDLIKVLGKNYVQIKNSECTRMEGFRIELTNELMNKTQVESVQVFLNEHSNEINAALTTQVNALKCKLIGQALNPIFYFFPIESIFDSY